MSQLLFKLHQVPEDEAQEVRDLLNEHGFTFYETHAGFWGLGVAAIWLTNAEDLPAAKAALADYQQGRREQQRRLYAEQEAEGSAPTLARRAAAHPIRFILMVAAIVLILGISILPFVGMIGR